MKYPDARSADSIRIFGLIMGRRSLSGSNIGGIAETEEKFERSLQALRDAADLLKK